MQTIIKTIITHLLAVIKATYGSNEAISLVCDRIMRAPCFFIFNKTIIKKKPSMRDRIMRKLKITVAMISTVLLTVPWVFISPPSVSTALADTGFTVSGVVYKPDGVTPVQFTGVNVRTDDFSKFYGGGTNDQGQYQIQNVPAGTYKLEAYTPWGLSGVMNADPVSITVSSDMTQNMTLKAATKTISGTVKMTTGAVVSGAMVNAWIFNGQGGMSTKTDANGAYTLSVGGGHYGVNVNPDTAPDAPAADWIYDGPPQEVNFADDTTAQTQTLNLTVTPAKATVVVTVTTTDGTPVTSGQVDVRSSDGRGNGQPLNNTNVITLRVPSGSYFVNYFDQNGKFSAQPQPINANDGQTTAVTLIVKEKTAHITGKLVDASGAPLASIRLNANCDPLGATNGGGGQGTNSNGTSAADGTFDILTTTGMCHINVDQGPDANYIYSGQPIDAKIASDTDSASVGNITLQYADATITGRILDESGNVVPQMPGWAYARPLQSTNGGPSNEFGGPVNNGRYTIKLPSKVLSVVQVGIHFPQNVQFSVKTNPTVTVVANSTTTQDLTIVQNTSSIYGAVVTPDGIPLTSCTASGDARFFGEVFVNNFEKGNGFNTQIKPDCSYEVSVGPGTYQFGYHLDEGSGFMNRPPSPDPIVVKANDRVAKNIVVVASDAKIRVTVVDPKGNKVPHVWVGADNHEEIFGGPMGNQGQGGPGGEGPKGLADQKGPGGNTDPQSIMKYCLDVKHKSECQNDKLPAGSKGPGGCTNTYECSQFCSKSQNKDECGRFFGVKGPSSGPGQPNNGPQTGPGGCKSETECKTFCSKPENQTECSKFGPAGTLTGAAFLPVKVKGESTDHSIGPKEEDFNKQINGGSQTDENGTATIAVVSGHKYTVNNGLPPESQYMPAPMQRCDLTAAKSCDLVMILQTSDVTVTGTVKIGNAPVTNGFVHAWSESGGFSGGPINNGTYKLNINSGATWHIGADSPQSRDFYRSDEVMLVTASAGKYTQNFQLSKNVVQLPDAVSTTFDATQQSVLTLRDGTTVTMPAGSIATSGSVTVTATPTVQINTTQTDQPAFGFGYEFKAIQNGSEITKFAASTVSILYKYSTDILDKLGISENSLVPKFYNASTGAWEKPDNILQDTTNKTLTVTGLSHFSVHSIVSTAGVKASKTNLTGVTTGKNKNGETQITVGIGKSFIPFSKYKGAVTVLTANLGGKNGQVIVAAPAEMTKDVSKVIVYKVTGNKKNNPNVSKVKELVPVGGYKKGLNVVFADVTQDGREDILVGTVKGAGEVITYDITSNYRSSGTMKIGVKRFSGSTTVTALEAYVKGVGALVAKAGDDTAVFSYNPKNGRFTRDTKYPVGQKIAVVGASMSMKNLAPKVTSSINVKYFADKNKLAAATIRGENFTRKTSVLINGQSVSVKFKNASTLDLTLKPGLFKKGGAYRFQISSTEGSTTSGKITFK